MSRQTKGTIGSSFEEFLREEGLHEAATAHAVKRVLAWQIEQAMREHGLGKSAMARRMGTSRSQLERLMDPENERILLSTLQKAASAVGRRLTVELAEADQALEEGYRALAADEAREREAHEWAEALVGDVGEKPG